MDESGKFDGHLWIEDDTGKIYDYEKKKLKKISLYGTNKIIRKPFPSNIENLIRDKKIAEAKDILKKTPQNLHKLFVENCGFCNLRVFIIYKKLKKLGINSTIRCGSLGFVQSNGDIFYEYG